MAKQKKPLAESFPDLAKEAHGWDPTQIHDLTNVKMEWICKKGHTWFAFTYTRTGKNPKGCPVCANKAVAIGSNDLESQFPELAKEADGWDPQTVSVGTHKKLGWKCSKGHKWQTAVANRVKGTGCPYCSNNKILTGFNDLSTIDPLVASEADGWDSKLVLSGTSKKLAWKCSKNHKWQASVSSRTGKMKTGCPYCWGRFVIEGETDLQTLYPKIANEAHGWNPSKVNAGSKAKMEFMCFKGHLFKTTIVSRASRGVGCNICANKVIVAGINDLATSHPELAKQASGWDPTKIVAGSNKKLTWLCSKNHKWIETPNKRTGRGDGCPFCSGNRVLIGFNDLAFTHPDLSSEADGWDARSYSAGSNKKLGWKCKLGHKWNTAVAARTGKLSTDCPVCANQVVLSGFNDLATKFPDLAKEADGWDPTKIGAGTNKKLSWKCKLNHKWNANVSSRTGLGTGCPVCANLQVQIGFNDIATTHPEMAQEAYGWDPTTIPYGSASKLEWKCSKGHIYSAPPIRRTTRNTGCSICANKTLLVGFNDLATTHPELAKEAYGWDPKKVNSGRSTPKNGKQNEKKKWKCPSGHIYEATPASRTNTHHQSGCPSCAKTGFDPNKDGWLYFLEHPDWEMLQIGITNVPDDRLTTHERLGWTVLELRGPMNGDLASQWETSILQMLKRHGAKLAPKEVAGKFDGYTEAWLCDSLPITSLKELMDLVRADEDNK